MMHALYQYMLKCMAERTMASVMKQDGDLRSMLFGNSDLNTLIFQFAKCIAHQVIGA